MTATETTNIEVACGIFEQLALEDGESVDRSRIRKAVEFAQSTWSDQSDDSWWRWVVDTGQLLGLRCKVVDCTFDQLQRVLRDGGKVVAKGAAADQWMAVTRFRAYRFHVYCPLSIYPSNWITKKQFLAFLEPGQIHRCVVIEPAISEALPTSQAAPSTPLRRFLELLRPDAMDLWIIVLFSFVSGLLALATPLAVEALVNTVAFGRFVQPIVVLSLMLLGFLLFAGTIQSLQAYAAEILQRRLFARMAADLSYRLPRVKHAFWDREHPREVLNRFLDIVTVQKVLTHFLMDGVGLALNTLIGMAILAFYHPWLLGFDVLLIMMIAFVIFVLGRGAVSSSIKESKVKYRMVAWLQDLAASPVAFRYDAASEFALERTDRLIYDYVTYRRKHFKILLRQIVFVLGLQALASTVLLGIGGWLVISGQLTLGQLVAAELIVTVIIGSFTKLDKHIESFYDVMAAIDKLGVLMDLPLEAQHGSLEPLPPGPAAVAVENLLLDGAAQEFSLDLQPGEHVAILSPTTAGRTQLLDCLYALSLPSSGNVRVHGTDVRAIRPDVLRRQVALVRGAEIFAATVEEQVHLERPSISSADVSRVLGDVGLLGELLKLPKGLETWLIANGFPLNAGQISRLMLARGMVGRPQLLLIDGTLDQLAHQQAVALVRHLADSQQPWTLLLVTAHEKLAQCLPRRLNYMEPARGTDIGDEAGDHHGH